jgi:uncharacterized protein YecT (DUF1311 family)
MRAPDQAREVTMRRIIGAALLVFAFSSSGAYAACDDTSTQADLTQCASEAAAKADTDLNAAYKTLLNLLGPEDQTRLRDAQRAWIDFRNAECAFRTKSYADGSIYPMLLSNCFADVTRARTADFEAQIACGEGDLCPPHVNEAVPASSGLTTIGGNNETRACRESDGEKRARLYVSHCVTVSEAGNPACDAAKSCGALVEAIRSGCAAKGADKPALCTIYSSSP